MPPSRVIGASLVSPPAIRPTRVEIDLDAVRANARRMTELAGVDLYAVVKADAYGHGAVAVARALAGQPGVAGFAVSLVEEGVELRDAGVQAPILVMGPALAGGYQELVDRDMQVMVGTAGDLEALAEIGRRRGARVPVHIKVDTGMSRLGILPGELAPVIEAAVRGGGVEIVALASHLACAETDDPADGRCQTRRQLAAFEDAVALARAAGARPRLLHTANSAAALRFPAARCDRVRTGIALYGSGVQPDDGELAPAMRWVTGVAQLRTVPAGTPVSYGALWTAPRDSRVAVLPVGYADGLTRRLTARAEALIGGKRCPMVGAISMDIAVVDVTDLGDAVAVGDEAVLLGVQGSERIVVRELAEAAGLIDYEVTCAVSRRVPRVHV